MDSSVRLNKFLALHAGISRREADELIQWGKVSINGEVAVVGAQVRPTDTVTLNGEPVATDTKLVYLELNKPVGYVSSRRRQGDNPTIYDLVPEQYHTLKPVGRLDRDSSGLILLSNDGDFALRMTHPSFGKVKKYEVELDKPLEPLHHQMIVDHGVNLDDGQSSFMIEKIDDINYQITMSEGRNRQIRRTFTALGYTVTKLHRTDFGPYTLGDIASGKFEIVSKL